MAIRGQYAFRGLNVPDGFVRIERMWGSPREGWDMLVHVYATKAQADAGEHPIETFHQHIDYAPNPFTAGQVVLRARFTNMTDEAD